MNSCRSLQKILTNLEQLNQELADLAQQCEYTRQRRLCIESQTMIKNISSGLEKGFSDLNADESYSGTLDRI